MSGQDAPLEQRLKAMDAEGIDMEALSINPFWYEADRDVATQLIKMQNEGLLQFGNPTGIPELDRRFAGNGRLNNVIGNPLEATIFFSHLIFDGTLDRYPGLNSMILQIHKFEGGLPPGAVNDLRKDVVAGKYNVVRLDVRACRNGTNRMIHRAASNRLSTS